MLAHRLRRPQACHLRKIGGTAFPLRRTVNPLGCAADIDGIGNFTTMTGGAVTNTYAANELNQYEEVANPSGTVEPTYTSNGELASFGPWTYAYDALSRLVAAYSNGTLVVSNRYDHLGRRVAKIAPDGTHTFLYDGWRPVIETVTRPGGGTDRIEFHWGKATRPPSTPLSTPLDGRWR